MSNLDFKKITRLIKQYDVYNSTTLRNEEKLLYLISNNRANRMINRHILNPLNKREGMLIHTSPAA